MRKRDSYELSRAQFYLLHQEILAACDRLLRNQGKGEGLCQENDSELYHYGESTYFHRSIKDAIDAHYSQEKLKRFGFRYRKDRYVFSGRQLYNCKRTYNQENQDNIPIIKPYLRLYLDLIGVIDARLDLQLREFEQMALKFSNETDIPDRIGPQNNRLESPARTELDRVLQDFQGSRWYYYFYTDKTTEEKRPGIVRLLLSFQAARRGTLRVHLEKGHEAYSDLHGKLIRESSKPDILIFNLYTESNNNHHSIIIRVNHNGGNELCIGQCQSFDTNYIISSRIIIVEKIGGHSTRADSREFTIENLDPKQVAAEIASYLEKNRSSRISSPDKVISNLRNLKDLIEE